MRLAGATALVTSAGLLFSGCHSPMQAPAGRTPQESAQHKYEYKKEVYTTIHNSAMPDDSGDFRYRSMVRSCLMACGWTSE